MDAGAFLFVCVALILIAATLFIMMSAGFARLESSIGIMRDGIPLGKQAPSWQLSDTQGDYYMTPTNEKWQFLIFANYSLCAFPLMITVMHALSSEKHLQ